MLITPELIYQIIPHAYRVEGFFPFLPDAMERFEINTPRRIGAFLSQVAEESNNFRATEEYASGAAYEGRKDLGNVFDGDGVKFKGRGLIQTTGRNNYAAVSKIVYNDNRIVLHPELMASPELAALSACIFWNNKNMNLVADMPEDWHHSGPHNYSKFQWLTILVNGGLNGYAERLKNYNQAKLILKF